MGETRVIVILQPKKPVLRPVLCHLTKYIYSFTSIQSIVHLELMFSTALLFHVKCGSVFVLIEPLDDSVKKK